MRPALLLALALVGCTAGETTTLSSGPIEERLMARAIVEPSEGAMRVSFPSTARVLDVLVEVGDRVEAGATLATYEPIGASEAESLVAPRAGTVIGRRVSPGDDVSRTDGPAFEVADLSRVRLRIELDDADVGRASPGSAVVMLADGALPDAVIERVLGAMEPSVIDADGSFVAVALAPIEPDPRLPLGRRLDVAVALGAREVPCRAPRDAVSIVDGYPAVRVLGGASDEIREVEIGAVDAAWVEIVGGASAGTRVRLAGRD